MVVHIGKLYHTVPIMYDIFLKILKESRSVRAISHKRSSSITEELLRLEFILLLMPLL